MENISSNAELHDAIQLLEAEQAVKLKLMKEQLHQAYENLKPAKAAAAASNSQRDCMRCIISNFFTKLI